jgi:hypothetical protein
MMHQIVDLGGYSSLEIGLRRWQLNIEPDGVTPLLSPSEKLPGTRWFHQKLST